MENLNYDVQVFEIQFIPEIILVELELVEE